MNVIKYLLPSDMLYRTNVRKLTRTLHGIRKKLHEINKNISNFDNLLTYLM